MERTHKTAQTKAALKEQRLEELMKSCRQQILQQVIGPFGLTPAMFDEDSRFAPESFKDKTGGNVTTQHNFEQGVTATTLDKERYEELVAKKAKTFERNDYNKVLPSKRKELFQKTEAPISAYTGNELSRDVYTNLDHVTAAKNIEMDAAANLFMTKEQRVNMANQDANLVACEERINKSMKDKDKCEWAAQERKADKGKTNAESFGVDEKILEQTVRESERAIERDLLVAQIKKQGSELAMTGAKEAGKNALRQAFGVLLYEFVNGAFTELWRLKSTFKDPGFIDRLIAAFKRVANRVVSKLGAALDAALQGGVQGFISNLLTFLINSVITTSAKVVTIIREGMKGLWEAIKMMVNPPEDMSFDEVCRQVTKIISGVVTISLGMLFEESVNAFFVSTGVPFAGVVSQVVSGLLTGVITALVIYGLDSLFDRLADKGTDFLQAQEAHLDELQNNLHHMADLLEAQYKNSTLYRTIAESYLNIGMSLETANEATNATNAAYENDIVERDHLLTALSDKKQQYQDKQQELDELMDSLNAKGWSA